MTVEIFTFYNYINNYNTEYTTLYKTIFDNSIELLPNKICSSKILYETLKFHIENNDYKRKVFNQTFCEYFRKKCGREY